MSRERPNRRPPTPLDAAALERLALHYVGRFATTRARLAAYLARKIGERGWDGPAAADPGGLAERLAALGYIDDRAFAEARAASMARRGLGARRVAGALHHAGVGAADTAAIAPDIADRAEASAIAFARRKRIGPFALVAPDRPQREKQIAAMIRAGHGFDLARRIVALEPGSTLEGEEID